MIKNQNLESSMYTQQIKEAAFLKFETDKTLKVKCISRVITFKILWIELCKYHSETYEKTTKNIQV